MTELTEQIPTTQTTIPKSKGKLQNRITLLLIAILIPILIMFAWFNIASQRRNLEALILQRAESTATSGAVTVQSFLEHALESGELSRDEIFDTNYQEFWQFDPTAYPDFEGDPATLAKYHTAYDAYTDEHLQELLDSFLSGEDIVFAVAADRNGYVPTHNTRSSTGDGDPATDRTKRIFNDPVGIKAVQNTEPIIQQIYQQSGTGKTFWDVSAPIYIEGEHWGAFRVGIELAQNQERVIAATWQTIFAMGLVVILVAVFSLFVGRYVSAPIVKLTGVATLVAGGNLNQQANIHNRQEISTLAQVFNSMTLQLRDLISNLEARVTARTQDLELAAEISQHISQIRDVDELTSTAVSLIQQRFNLYHTQLYLADPEQTSLTLLASTGEAGRQMLAAGHTLDFNASSINGRAAANKQPVLVANTATSENFKPHPLLPNTRSETAVPLLIGNNVVGVLDLQSSEPNTFTEESLPAFVTLAGQLAVAIENSALFTQQERLATELQRNAAFLDTIFDSLPLMLFVKDAQNLRFVRYNQAGSDMIGIPVAEMLGKSDYDFFPKEEADFFTSKDREVLANGLIVDIPEEALQTAHRGSRLLHTTKVPILGANGEPQYLLGIAEDITERKAIETDLVKFKLGMERSADAIFMTDVNGTITYVNDAFVEIYGYSKEEAIGNTPRIIKSGLIDQQGYEYFWQTLLSGGIVAGELVNKHKNGRLINIDGNNNPITDESGQVIGFLAMHQDITERKQIEATNVKQATELQTVAELSTAVTTTLDTKQLLFDIVNGTKERFNLYHVHIYLVDETSNTLKLAAGAGEVGATMVKAGYHIPYSHPNSLVAKVARTKQGVIVNNVMADPAFLPNPLLFDTKSELAVPMMVGNKLIGVLDAQANTINHFATTDISIQTTLATQIAIALENARAFEQANEQAAIIQSTPNIIATSAPDGTIRFLNEAGLQRLGYDSLAEVVGQPVSIFYPPDPDETHQRLVIETVQKQGLWQGESVMITKSGEQFPVDQIVTLIRDEDGRPRLTAVNMTEITARKQAEEAIQRNEALMRTIIDSTPDWIFVKDNQHHYQLVNKAYADTAHVEPEALIGKTILDVGLPPEIAQSIMAEDEAFMAGEETLIVSEENVVVDGKTRYQTITKVLLKDALRQTQGMVGFTHNVTAQVTAAAEQKQLRQELEGQLERVNALQSAMTREGWRAFMTTTAGKRPFQGFEFNDAGIKPLTTEDLHGKNTAAATGNKTAVEQVNAVKIQGTTIGKIGVRNANGEPLTEKQRDLFASLTDQVAVALDRARLFEETELGRQEIEEQAAELTTVNEISELVSSQLNLQSLVDAVGDRFIETFLANSVYIALVDEKEKMISFPYFTNRVDGPMNVSPRALDEQGGFTGKIYKTKQPVIHNSSDGDIAAAAVAQGAAVIDSSHDSNSYIGVPMIVGEKVIGVIGLNGQQDRRMYDEKDVPLLTTLASTIAVALQNTQQFEETQRRANREALVNEISQKIQNATTIESAMQTAVTELGKALGIQRAVVELNKPGSSE